MAESQRIYDSLAHHGGDDYEWVPTAWIKAWLLLQPTGIPLSPLDQPPATKLDAFDVSGLLCEHKWWVPYYFFCYIRQFPKTYMVKRSLSVRSLSDVKRVSHAAVDAIIANYCVEQPSVRLIGPDSCCVACTAVKSEHTSRLDSISVILRFVSGNHLTTYSRYF